MAYYSSNELLDAQVYWSARADELVMRRQMFPFIQLFMRNGPMFVANWNEIKESEKRNATAHLLDRSPAPTTSARSCTHTDCCGDCTSTSLSWTPYVAKNICMSADRSSDNMFDWDAQFANQVMNRQMDIFRDIELAIYAYCIANQTQVHNGVNGLGTWVNDIWRVPIANRTEYFSYCYQMMIANRYQGQPLDFVNSLSVGAQFNYINQQGPGNSFNLAWQNAGITMHQSADIATTANYFGDTIIIPRGGAGMVPWIPKKNRQNTGEPGGVAGYWTSMPDILGLGMDIAVHITESCSDTSQTNGTTQDYVRNYELSLDACITSPPFAGNETSIYHAGLYNS